MAKLGKQPEPEHVPSHRSSVRDSLKKRVSRPIPDEEVADVSPVRSSHVARANSEQVSADPTKKVRNAKAKMVR